MAPNLSISGFHHVTLIARDAARTIEFYRDILGFSLLRRAPDGDSGTELLLLGDPAATPGTLISVIEQPTAPRGRWGLGSVHHVALGVASLDALLKWKRRLEDFGFPVTGPLDRRWFQSIYFTDPDGQILEIATAGPGYAVDEPITALGQRVIVPPPEYLRGTRDDAAAQAQTWAEPAPVITPEMVLDGIHHVSAITDDIVRADEFYHAALGLRLVKKSVNQDFPESPHWLWAAYDGQTVKPRSALTFFGFPDMRRRGTAGAGLTDHIAFRARDRDEVGAWQDHLRALGLDVSNGTHFDAIRFQAPDGLWLEIGSDGAPE